MTERTFIRCRLEGTRFKDCNLKGSQFIDCRFGYHSLVPIIVKIAISLVTLLLLYFTSFFEYGTKIIQVEAPWLLSLTIAVFMVAFVATTIIILWRLISPQTLRPFLDEIETVLDAKARQRSNLLTSTFLLTSAISLIALGYFLQQRPQLKIWGLLAYVAVIPLALFGVLFSRMNLDDSNGKSMRAGFWQRLLVIGWGTSFGGSYLDDVLFKGRTISRTSFASSYLNHTIWEIGHFEECVFRGSNLELEQVRSLVIDKILKEDNIPKCTLHSLSLTDSSLRDVKFNGTKLVEIDFSNTSLNKVTFKGCCFENVIFRECQMREVSFEHCTINPEQLRYELSPQSSRVIIDGRILRIEDNFSVTAVQ